MESSQLPPDKAVHRSTHHLTFTDCLLRECVHLFVCVCVRVLRWMYALRRGLNSLLIFFLFSCLFYLIFYGFWKCTPVKKVVHVCMCEKLWCVCVCASEPVLWSCSSVCLPLVLQFSISSYRLTPPCRGTTHTHKKQTKQESDHEDPTSAVSRNLEIENYDVCDILRFLCPVFTWLVCFYCFSNPSLSVRLCCL